MRIVRTVAAVAALALASSSAFAQETTNNTSSGSNSGAWSNSGSAGNSTNVNVDGKSSSSSWSGAQSAGNTTIIQSGKRGASSAIAPGLFASGLSCSGSAGAGGAGAGWGFSFGFTKSDVQCDTRENAKTVLGLTGDREATKEVLCDIRQVRSAFQRVGRPCIADYQRAAYNDRSGYASPARTPSRRVTFKTMAECREYQRTHNVSCVRR